MAYKQLSFSFKELPQFLLKNDIKLLNWSRGIEKEIFSYFGEHYKTIWSFQDEGQTIPVLKIEVTERETEYLICMLHNLFGGKVLGQNS